MSQDPSSLSRPAPWETCSPSELQEIGGVCLDIDDTLSTHGKLTAEAYGALWKLQEAGFLVVPITGRPAGWCDHIARFWPVDAVVGENGAFTFFMADGKRQRLDTPNGLNSPEEAQKKLATLAEALKKKIPGVKWASDQAYREFDLAIDFCEDVKPMHDKDVRYLQSFCEELGAHAKRSSIHVNAWYGDYDKIHGFRHWVQERKPAFKRGSQWIFIGDSPNDEPMFENFEYSVGVANLKPYLTSFVKKITTPPRWITEKESGAGFVEFAQKLLGA